MGMLLKEKRPAKCRSRLRGHSARKRSRFFLEENDAENGADDLLAKIVREALSMRNIPGRFPSFVDTIEKGLIIIMNFFIIIGDV